MNDVQGVKLSALRMIPELVDIGKKGHATQSSVSRWSKDDDAQNAVLGIDRDFAFHTDREETPWWSLAFDVPVPLRYLVLENRRTPRFRSFADRLTIEVETPQGRQTVYDDTRSFGIEREDNALVVALDGAGPINRILITARTGGGHFHLSRIRVLAQVADIPAGVLDTGARPVVLANRADGFGERIKAVLNAMAVAERMGADFRFGWRTMSASIAVWHDVLPAKETFSQTFMDRFFETKESIHARAAVPLSNAALAQKAHAGQSYLVSQARLEVQCPDLFPEGTGDIFIAYFAAIEFTSHLEKARACANAVDLTSATGSVALHLRAGDLIFGRYRKMDRYHRKACGYPIAEAIAADMQAQGRRLVLFGQDADFIAYLVDRYGAISAATFAEGQNFDSQQQALFDICLMARCDEVICGSSGFANLACWIGGIDAQSPYRYYDKDKTLGLLEGAGRVGADDDPGVADLQKSFAIWLAFILSGRAIADTPDYVALLDRAIALDPENEFFRIVKASSLIHAGDLAGADQVLLACAAGDTVHMLDVLGGVHPDGVSQIAAQMPYLAKAAEVGHPMAALCLAIGHMALDEPDEAARYGAIWRAHKGQIETPLEKHLDAV